MLKKSFFSWLVIALAFLTIAIALFFPIKSDDVFMYLALGRRLFNGGIPAIDPFLFGIPDYHWHVLHEWGTYVCYYAAYLLGGYGAVIALKDLLICLMVFIAAYPLIRQRKFFLIPLLALALYPGAERFEEKASLFSDLFTLLLMSALLGENISKRFWLVGIPTMFLLWANLHPGMPVGLFVFVLALAVKFFQKDFVRTRLWLSSLVLSVLGCLVNPEGWQGFIYPFEKILDPHWQIYRNLFFEWRPTFTPGFAMSAEVFVLVAMWVIAALVLLKNAQKKPLLESAFLALLIYLGSDAIRFMMLASLGALLIMAKYLSRSHWDNRYENFGWIGAGILQIGLLIAICTGGYPTFNGIVKSGGGIDEDLVPVKAADFLEKTPWQGNMFNETNWGSYFAWRWDGQRKVFYHGHIDDPTFLDQTYMDIYRSPEKFDKLIHDYNIQIFVTTKAKLVTENPQAIQNLIQHVDKDWKIAYFDNMAAVLFRVR